jgi:acylphosphatase
MRRSAIVITGRVQGVFYRAHALEEGQRLQLRGWVRNAVNGDVEALVEGPDDAVAAFITWCHQGSPAASVQRVHVTDQPVAGDLDAFAIRY